MRIGRGFKAFGKRMERTSSMPPKQAREVVRQSKAGLWAEDEDNHDWWSPRKMSKHIP